jgi:hypothetical protein
MRAQPPAVDNIADEINRVRAVMPQEIGKPVATTRTRSEMKIGQE